MTLTGIAQLSDLGDNYVKFRAFDLFDFVETNLTLTIVENFPPVAPVGLTTSISSIEGLPASANFAVFTDAEGDPISYSMTFTNGSHVNTSSWVTFDEVARQVTFTPIHELTSPFYLNLVVSDPYNADVITPIQLNIDFAPKDNTSVVDRTGYLLAGIDSTAYITSTVIYDENPIVSFGVLAIDGSAVPSWISIKYPNVSASGDFEFSGTYPLIEYKLFEFTLYATDIYGLVGSANVFIQTKGKVIN